MAYRGSITKFAPSLGWGCHWRRFFKGGWPWQALLLHTCAKSTATEALEKRSFIFAPNGVSLKILGVIPLILGVIPLILGVTQNKNFGFWSKKIWVKLKKYFLITFWIWIFSKIFNNRCKLYVLGWLVHLTKNFIGGFGDSFPFVFFLLATDTLDWGILWVSKSNILFQTILKIPVNCSDYHFSTHLAWSHAPWSTNIDKMIHVDSLLVAFPGLNIISLKLNTAIFKAGPH